MEFEERLRVAILEGTVGSEGCCILRHFLSSLSLSYLFIAINLFRSYIAARSRKDGRPAPATAFFFGEVANSIGFLGSGVD